MIGGGRLAENVVRFARLLRAAGLRVAPDRARDAAGAVAEVGVAAREDFYWALHAVLVSRPEERPVFDEAFRLFWREPSGPLAAPPVPGMRIPAEARRAAARRVAEALAQERGGGASPPPRTREAEGALLAWSDREVLRRRDFEQMSAAELREAERAIDALRLPVRELRTRRLAPHSRGERVDPRATLRASLRTGPSAIPLRWRSPRARPPVVVALVDVSGSMSRYARPVLRFLHALSRRHRVHSFTFGTRLTDVTRRLRHRDPDAALAAVGRAVQDWDGGTRIGAALREFNLRWSRRLLAQGALVLLVTDGLDREDARGLAQEAARLRRSCRRLVWLNPLLRFAGFEPRAAGVRALLPNVDEMRPVHDLESLSALAEALGATAVRREASRAARAAGARAATPRRP